MELSVEVSIYFYNNEQYVYFIGKFKLAQTHWETMNDIRYKLLIKMFTKYYTFFVEINDFCSGNDTFFFFVLYSEITLE